MFRGSKIFSSTIFNATYLLHHHPYDALSRHCDSANTENEEYILQGLLEDECDAAKDNYDKIIINNELTQSKMVAFTLSLSQQYSTGVM